MVKRVDYGNITVDLQRAEGVIRRDETIPRESLRVNDRVRAYIFDVREEPRGPQIFLSRTHPQFMAKLFAQEVPEIYDGIIEIKAVARDPGSRAKIAVLSHDSSIDPVGACVGMRGSRVQAVVQELQGEKIDIIPWSHDTANFIVNALAPAEVSKVVMDEEKHRTEVVVPDDQLSLAIGRRGQNVRLASQLTGWDIDIMTEAEESERRQKEIARAHRAVHGRARRRRRDRPSAGGRRLRRGRGRRRFARSRIWPASRASTRRSPPSCSAAPASSSRSATRELRDRAWKSSASTKTCATIEGLTPADAGGAGREGREDAATTSPTSPPTSCARSSARARWMNDTANAIIMKAREHWFAAEDAAAAEAAKA